MLLSIWPTALGITAAILAAMLVTFTIIRIARPHRAWRRFAERHSLSYARRAGERHVDGTVEGYALTCRSRSDRPGAIEEVEMRLRANNLAKLRSPHERRAILESFASYAGTSESAVDGSTLVLRDRTLVIAPEELDRRVNVLVTTAARIDEAAAGRA